MKMWKLLLSNTLSLSVIQGVYLLVPLILVPYLIGALGVIGYGELVYTLSLVAVFKIFIEYGFDLTVTRYISENQNDINIISRKYSLVLSAKFLIWCVLFPVYFLFSSIVFDIAYFIAILAYCSILPDVLFANWYFQGVQKLKALICARLASRVLFCSFVFYFLTVKIDY